MTRDDAAIESQPGLIGVLWVDGRHKAEVGYKILETVLFEEPGQGTAHSCMGRYACARLNARMAPLQIGLEVQSFICRNVFQFLHRIVRNQQIREGDWSSKDGNESRRHEQNSAIE